MDLLTSIKGIGVTLAAALIVATGRFSYFDNAKQLTATWACHLLTINRYVSQCQRPHQPKRGFKPQKPTLCSRILIAQVQYRV